MKRIVQGIRNKRYMLLQFFTKLYFNRILKQPHYRKIENSQLLLNWVVQRMFGINRDVPFSVSFTSKIQGFKNIILNGDPESMKISFAVSGGCYFTVFDGTTLEIGENTIWAFNLCVQTGNHDTQNREKYRLASVKIGKNCWLGNTVTILPGVELGDNVTVGANSVVTKSFSSNSVIAGCPAKLIGTSN